MPHGPLVQYAILFDRLFRFPITGDRVRNYDGLGGQLLFAYLHRNDVVRWTDNRLHIDWDRLAEVVADLCGEIEKLYRDGIDRLQARPLAGRATSWSRPTSSRTPARSGPRAPARCDLTEPPRRPWSTRCCRTSFR